ncbi:isocyanide synthase family protein [Thermomonospora umbrina]|uniref:Pyoverdine/dityrosine biosynthesis protein Dit1 n=1 Tax=Thermomonospora umbrina TaxID=111806 RepID=A0A3D9SRB0_9ACTN|nr:isocyanide synthase family protein [Thermomonospora umbrina]REE96483.1 pyoverdine/dityrosine biosynthesis protein Dit1 [Thermomonospora umbrina]
MEISLPAIMSPAGVGHAVLGLLLAHRRADLDTPGTTFDPQLAQLDGFIAAGRPIVFTLPGFPCKSPNPAKVLGPLPDTGELLSLRFLDGLCARIGHLHPAGARIVVCSDGHVFGDLIGVPDPHIDAYSDTLRRMIDDEGLTHLDTFDLRSVHGDLPYDAKRAAVEADHAPSLDRLRAEVRTDEAARRLYRGITRFLIEDAAESAGTRSARQRDARRRAYGVIRRSRAWSEIIALHHPGTVRLSIHPQRRGAGKLGIRLLDAADVWTTPWHSCAFRHRDGRWELMRRADAERLGTPVLRDGRPVHFEAR